MLIAVDGVYSVGKSTMIARLAERLARELGDEVPISGDGDWAAGRGSGQHGRNAWSCASQPGFTGQAGDGGAGAGVLFEVDGRLSFTDSGCGGLGPAPGGLGVGGGGTGGGGGGGLHGGGGGGWGDKPNGGTIFKGAGGGGGGGGSSFIERVEKITSGVATPDGNGSVTITYNTPK